MGHSALGRLVPDAHLATVWLNSDSKLEFREGPLVAGDEIAIAPDEINSLVRQLVGNCYFSEKRQETEAVWEGPRSLVTAVDNLLSAPLGSAWQWSASRVSESLSIARVQFLQPPDGEGKLLNQFVGIVRSTESRRNNDTEASGTERAKRVRRLLYPNVSAALEVAVSNPSRLQPRQRDLLSQVLPVGGGEESPQLPISFSSPFSGCWATSDGKLNILHSFGQAVTRCLAACSIAERDGRVGSETHESLERIAEENIFSLMTDPEKGDGLRKFVAKLFEIVTRHELITNFVAPEVPLEEERVPKLSDRVATATFSFLWGHGYKLDEIKCPFGKVITSWPLAGNSTSVGDGR